MEYRIKVVEKNNGEKKYLPQYRYEGLFEELLILLYPLALIVFICTLDWESRQNYWWRDFEKTIIDTRKGNIMLTVDVPLFFDTKAEADEAIENHKLKKSEEQQIKDICNEQIKMQKIKSVHYIYKSE